VYAKKVQIWFKFLFLFLVLISLLGKFLGLIIFVEKAGIL